MTEDDELGVPASAFLTGNDVFIIYSFEDVAFHWDANTKIVRKRFRGNGKETITPSSNRLYMDARMGGRIASEKEYYSW